MKKETAVTPEVATEIESEAVATKKEKVAKKIKKLAARSAQLINYIQANQEGRNTAELIIEGVFKTFGGFEEVPGFAKVVEMVGKYQESPEKAEKVLAPLDEEKRSARRTKRIQRKQNEIEALVEARLKAK